MDIGKESPAIVVEPVEDPVVRPTEQPEPVEPDKAPAETPTPT